MASTAFKTLCRYVCLYCYTHTTASTFFIFLRDWGIELGMHWRFNVPHRSKLCAKVLPSPFHPHPSPQTPPYNHYNHHALLLYMCTSSVLIEYTILHHFHHSVVYIHFVTPKYPTPNSVSDPGSQTTPSTPPEVRHRRKPGCVLLLLSLALVVPLRQSQETRLRTATTTETFPFNPSISILYITTPTPSDDDNNQLRRLRKRRRRERKEI